MDAVWGEMNGQYEWGSPEIVLPFELHSGWTLMVITLEERSNSQGSSIWADIPSVTEASKKKSVITIADISSKLCLRS